MSPLRGFILGARFPTAHAVGYVDSAAPRLRLRDPVLSYEVACHIYTAVARNFGFCRAFDACSNA